MAAARSAAPARPASRRHLHGRLLEVSGEDRLRLLHRVDLEQPLTQLGRARHSLRVPAEMLAEAIDRKSTRLNSSHVRISYAVFCLKKKKNNPAGTTEY